MILDNNIMNQPWMIFILILVIFGVLALGIFLIRKFVINKNKQEEKPTEEEAASDTLNRYLEDVEDPETLKEFDEYKKENGEESK